MKRILFVTVLVPFLAVTLMGDVVFSGLDLSKENELLFQAEADLPGYGSYNTMFFSELEFKTLNQLTFFPEKAVYLPLSGQVQIQNRFGVFRTGSNMNKISPVAKFSSFVNGKQIKTGKILPITASPDGKYLLYLEPISDAKADLMLYHIEKEVEIRVVKSLDLTLDDKPGLWSPNSRFFIYSRDKHLYYYSIDQLNNDRVIAEQFRSIGKGSIESATWGNYNNLYYIEGSLVYKVLSAELFTRSLYSGLFSTGSVVGKIPYEFDPSFDKFWISPDGKSILFSKEGRSIFLYLLKNDDYQAGGAIQSYPYLLLPRSARVKKVIWSRSHTITILVDTIENGEPKSIVFRLTIDDDYSDAKFEQSDDTDIKDIVLSRDGTKVVLVGKNKISVKTYDLWEIDTFSSYHPNPMHVFWRSDDTIIVAGAYYTEMINILDKSSRILSLSQPGDFGFNEENGAIQMRLLPEAGAGLFTYDNDTGQWVVSEGYNVADINIASDKYRVYFAKARAGAYENVVMVRDIKGYGTTSLFPEAVTDYEAFPDEDDPVNYTNFAHGSRIRRREVSLVFNAIDTVDGLTEILSTLNEFGLTCTFFVNGEFIRRHPGAVKEIAESGHEVGSLFHVYFDMVDARFKVDKEFIMKGLARNEDDYFATTGKELSLLWHAPYYFVNDKIIEASREMNYTYIGRDIDSMDWVTPVEKGKYSGIYMSAPDLVERIIDLKRPGSIVPIRVGKTENPRDDYLFHKLDILINSLINRGYKIVPVSMLMENAK